MWFQRQYLVRRKICFRIRTCNLIIKERFHPLSGPGDLNSRKLWTKISSYPELQDLRRPRKRRNTYPLVKTVMVFNLMKMILYTKEWKRRVWNRNLANPLWLLIVQLIPETRAKFNNNAAWVLKKLWPGKLASNRLFRESVRIQIIPCLTPTITST